MSQCRGVGGREGRSAWQLVHLGGGLRLCTSSKLTCCHGMCYAVQAAGFKDRLQRSHAEMQNLIARTNREKETLQTYAVQVIVEHAAMPTGMLQHGLGAHVVKTAESCGAWIMRALPLLVKCDHA